MPSLIRFSRIVLRGAAWLAGCCSPLDAAIYLQAGRCFDGFSDALREQVTIVVEGTTIGSILGGFVEGGEGDTTVQLHEHTVMPGLFDMHTHLSSQYSPRTYAEQFFLNPAEYALRAAHHAEKTLLAGFTSVRDLGDRHLATISLKKAIANGWAEGPRIYTAGTSIATTGGHADRSNGVCFHLMGRPEPDVGVINGPYEAREAVRQRYKEGSDVIKITATGGVLSLARSGQNPQFMDDELAAIVEAARDYGMTVAVHAHGDEGARRAVLAGVDSIEHGTFLSDETMLLMKERGTYLVPTISAGEWVSKKADVPEFFPDVIRPKAATIGRVIKQTFARALVLGVKIAFGTDVGVSEHGTNAREFVYMVDAGMAPLETLKCATSESARLLEVHDTLGTLEAGKLADIIAVPGNPLEDIALMQSVTFVMKDGRIHKSP